MTNTSSPTGRLTPFPDPPLQPLKSTPDPAANDQARERRERIRAGMGTSPRDVTAFSYGYLRGMVEATLAGAPLEQLREALEDLTAVRREKGLRT